MPTPATGPVYESYQYDANGSLTQISGNRNLSLSWDANNRASAISGRTYRYDPSDYRIGKGGTGATLNYYLDGEHLDAVYDGGITVQSQHLRGSIIDEVVYSYQRDNTNKLVAATSHHDALQSVLGESNHQGSIQYRQAYTAFGTATNPSQPQRYTGREMDSESGLYYYRARYYDPVIGRFISEDPLGFQAGVNFYAYCLNNPVNCNDPSGQISIGSLISGVAKLGGRLGSAETRALNESVAKQFLDANPGFRLVSGGGKAERLIPNPATLNEASRGAKGGAFGDIVLENSVTGENVIINTVTTLADGVTPVARELAAAARIQNLRPNSQFIMVSKATGAVIGTFAAGVASADEGIFGTGISANNIANFITDFLTPGGVGEVGVGSDIVPRSGSFNSGAFSFGGGAANGGFLLYPNKSNTNTVQSVYSK